MVEVILSFLYIASFCLCIGSGIRKLFGNRINFPEANVTRLIVMGVIALTVTVGWISIFCRIGVIVHLLLLVLAAGSAYYSRKELAELFRSNPLTLTDYICGGVVVLIIAFATSRGTFHTDTGIYHAAAIRLYEEYGVVKGIANIQLHYGYNSSYLGFASLFTLGFLLPDALHTTTGFLMTVFALDALYHLKRIREHRNHFPDAMRIAVLCYILMNYTGAMSPATDYSTMLMTGYFLTEWAEFAHGDSKDRDIFGLLSIYALFLTTMKLSSAMCVLVVILPFCYLVKAREWKKTGGFLAAGLLCFCFYPVRNVILSGWLFYPFESIDLFNVPWKVPVEYSLVDSAQIKVWGKCLFDVSKADMPVSGWFPIWWEAQEHYDQMLIYGAVLAVVLLMFTLAVKAMRRLRKDVPGENPRRENGFHAPVFMMYVMIFANLLVWFFTAPFIRYGLIFLFALPLLAIAGFYDTTAGMKEESPVKPEIAKLSGIAGDTLVLFIAICFFARIDHYVTDDLVFAKQNLKAPYYFIQQPFDNPDMGVMYLGDVQIPIYYAPGVEEINSYYTPPSTCYDWMAERSEPLGTTVKDGFRAK